MSRADVSAASAAPAAIPDAMAMGRSVVLTDDVRRDVAIAVQVASSQLRRDGIRLPATLRRFLAANEVAERAALAQRGTAEAREQAGGAASWDDEIDAKEAADMIGCSREWAGRLARDGRLGQTRKARGARRMSRAGVQAYIDDRSAS